MGGSYPLPENHNFGHIRGKPWNFFKFSGFLSEKIYSFEKTFHQYMFQLMCKNKFSIFPGQKCESSHFFFFFWMRPSLMDATTLLLKIYPNLSISASQSTFVTVSNGFTYLDKTSFTLVTSVSFSLYIAKKKKWFVKSNISRKGGEQIFLQCVQIWLS